VLLDEGQEQIERPLELGERDGEGSLAGSFGLLLHPMLL
jgi:hypothetical protein